MKSRVTTPVKLYSLVVFYSEEVKSPLTKEALDIELNKLIEDDIALDYTLVIEVGTGKIFEVNVEKSYKLTPQKKTND